MRAGTGAVSAARALDAADGVIDGKFYGRPIVTRTAGGAAGGSITRRVVSGGTVVSGGAYQSSAAHAVDAADGVIDGKYFGHQIIETGASRYGGVSVGASEVIVGERRLVDVQAAKNYRSKLIEVPVVHHETRVQGFVFAAGGRNNTYNLFFLHFPLFSFSISKTKVSEDIPSCH